jgi:hypothetical protein
MMALYESAERRRRRVTGGVTEADEGTGKPRRSGAFAEGGGYRDRTGDLRLAKAALSQLS